MNLEGARNRDAAARIYETVACALAGGGMFLALWACSKPPPRGNLRYIQQNTFSIENPSADRAIATGIGCGFTMNDAEQSARETARFNLRRLTGDARYRVQFVRLKETVEASKVCIELQAQAIPPRLN
jgi:hypothetical protein